MLSEDKYFKTLTQDELWQRYCGFLDLSIDEFMDIQKELLMDEIEQVADSVLGKKIMGNQKPKSVEEFRHTVPLTTYEDYEPYLSEQREDVLAIKPYLWCHSSGKGGRFKWVPYSRDFLENIAKRSLSVVILASAKRKGEVNISPGSRFLLTLPPPPYTSGYVYQFFRQQFSYKCMPPLEAAKETDFQKRIEQGFRMALKDGVDIIASMGSVLVRVGKEFSEQTQRLKFSRFMLHPKIMARLMRAWLRSSRDKRAILPKDIWSPRGIITAGVDTAIYKDEVAHYWGSQPCEVYGCTEGGVTLAVQYWNRKGMVFLPDVSFLEFIPYEEQLKHQDEKDYQYSTVLLDEVEEGKSYDVVITQLYGMPLLRYRMKDLIKVIALRDDEAGVNLPHITFQRKVDEVINIANLAQLDEKTIWRAVVNTGLKFADWSACKEYDANQSFLRLYLELEEVRDVTEVETMIDEQIKIVDTDYKDIDSYLGLKPVRVTLLAPGTFKRYVNERVKDGADLAHLKPAHINPSEAVIQRLFQLSQSAGEK